MCCAKWSGLNINLCGISVRGSRQIKPNNILPDKMFWPAASKTSDRTILHLMNHLRGTCCSKVCYFSIICLLKTKSRRWCHSRKDGTSCSPSTFEKKASVIVKMLKFHFLYVEKHLLSTLVSVTLTFTLYLLDKWLNTVSLSSPSGRPQVNTGDYSGNHSSVLYTGHQPNTSVWYRGLLCLLTCSRAFTKIAAFALSKMFKVHC